MESVRKVRDTFGLGEGENPADRTGSTYLDAMRVAVVMLKMCDTYDELLSVLADLNEILRGDKIEAIFPRS